MAITNEQIDEAARLAVRKHLLPAYEDVRTSDYNGFETVEHGKDDEVRQAAHAHFRAELATKDDQYYADLMAYLRGL